MDLHREHMRTDLDWRVYSHTSYQCTPCVWCVYTFNVRMNVPVYIAWLNICCEYYWKNYQACVNLYSLLYPDHSYIQWLIQTVAGLVQVHCDQSYKLSYVFQLVRIFCQFHSLSNEIFSPLHAEWDCAELDMYVHTQYVCIHSIHSMPL